MQYIAIDKAAEILGKTPRHIRRQCDSGKLVGARKESGKWMIPIAAHEKLLAPERLAASDQLQHLPIRKRDEAIDRLGILNDCEKYAASFVRSGGQHQTAIKLFVKSKDIALRTLYRWQEMYRQFGLIGLVDSRGMSDIAQSAFSPEASTELLRHYLTPNKLSLKQCYDVVLHKNKTEDLNWQIPGLRSVYKYVQDSVPEPVIVLHRDGKAAYEAKCCSYIEADPDSFTPGECWVGDHHQLNFWIRYRKKWVRPWVTAWMDMRSRMLVGWYLSASPNQTTVMQAMRAGIESYGPPDAVKIDNGKDYDSQMWTGQTKKNRKSKGYLDETMVAGLYAMMNISVTFSIPYHPQSKPIERFFHTLDIQFSRTVETWCGHRTDSKPEDLNERLTQQGVIDRGLTFSTLAEQFARWVKVYNSTVHTGAGMDGRTPEQVLRTRANRRVISSDVLDMLMCVWSGELKVGKNGVRFANLRYGQYEPRLLQIFGKKVRVSYNPADMRTITVYDAESLTYVCAAEQNELIKYGQPVAEEAMREAQRQKASVVKAHKNWIAKQPKRHMDLTDLTIAAMADAAEDNKPTEPTQQARPTLRPVRTPLDLHVDVFKRERKQKMLRKAAGAESAKLIDLDLSVLGQAKPERIKLFDD